ncbi:DHS-like NAD/FAD-binding domain-containing protein, partial [Zopfia rhizophila CBS 207.26]
ALREIFLTKRDIIVISAACMPVNAGISDFRTSSGNKTSSRHLFDINTYNSDEPTSDSHRLIREISLWASRAKPTFFHYYLNDLAKDLRLLRLYDQNVDSLSFHTMVPALWARTVALHGRLDTAICQQCGYHATFIPEQFCGKKPPWFKMGKRSRSVGFLRPKVLLYGESSPDESEITDAFKHDLRQPVDAVIIVGTRLLIPSLRRFVERLCQEAKSEGRESITMWVNKEPPKLARRSSPSSITKSLEIVTVLLVTERGGMKIMANLLH